MLLTPGPQGCWGLQHRKPPAPRGGVWLLGEMAMVVKGWWGNQQLRDLSLHSWEASGMLPGWIHVTQTGWDVLPLQMRGFGMVPTRDGNTEGTHAPQVCWGVNGSELGDSPVTNPGHQSW